MTETNCQDDQHAPPRIGVRRWGDACFHEVEEETPDGYVVEGFLIPRHQVCEILDLASGAVPRTLLNTSLPSNRRSD